MTYREAKLKRLELDATLNTASRAMRSYPEGDMGLTPDPIKATPEWRADRKAYNEADNALRNFNQQFHRVFAREIKAEQATIKIRRTGESEFTIYHAKNGAWAETFPTREAAELFIIENGY